MKGSGTAWHFPIFVSIFSTGPGVLHWFICCAVRPCPSGRDPHADALFLPGLKVEPLQRPESKRFVLARRASSQSGCVARRRSTNSTLATRSASLKPNVFLARYTLRSSHLHLPRAARRSQRGASRMPGPGGYRQYVVRSCGTLVLCDIQ